MTVDIDALASGGFASQPGLDLTAHDDEPVDLSAPYVPACLPDEPPGPPTRTAEVEVAGRPFALRTSERKCAHGVQINLNSLVAFLHDEEGNLVGWEARLRAQCGECGLRFDFDPAKARRPTDGDAGIVVILSPVEE